MGLCLPWQEAHEEFRAQFAAAWGFSLGALASLHGKMEGAIRHISTLATFAHHRKAASDHGCPKTWAEMLRYGFTLEASARALEEIVKPADISPLSQGGCSICKLHRELAGTDEGPGCPHTMADVQYIGGGVA
eukprot:5764003-Pyramimonas_sp.AAC.1